jgi:hypothetical protein
MANAMRSDIVVQENFMLVRMWMAKNVKTVEPRHGLIVVRMEVADQHLVLSKLRDEDVDVLDVRETLQDSCEL